ncbi:hypothetical protein JYU34_000948 [Plutella xylostella]|uniref:NADP-dependent oxidoreductase domain-containing protein n=1 Tax=Plutella xylostella TaxID=51655 RepID=A0ABQ7R5U5_PLUXY|nr:hypothetical protein JYU34_000948 [Plutella xylostella]
MARVVFLCLLLSVLAVAQAADQTAGKAPRLPLNDGRSIPALGLGTFLGFDEKGQKAAKEREVENAVSWALKAGYRLIDTASLYNNEHLVASGIEESGVKREDVFIVTKLGTPEQRDVLGSLRKSLQRLNTSYVDLYLIHFPIAFKADLKTYDVIDYLDTWRAMEEAHAQGLARSIGVSNFNVTQMQRLLDNCRVKPAVLQVEVNLNLAQEALLNFTRQHDIQVMAYSPFGSLFDSNPAPPPPRVGDETLVTIAGKYKKTTPQVVLRYLIQRGVVPIPKSVRKEKIEQNIDVFDFELTPEEMDTLSKFNKNYRLVWPTFWQDHPYYPFEQSDKPGPNPFEGVKE